MKVVHCLIASHADRDDMVSETVRGASDVGKVDAVVHVNGGQHHFSIEFWDKVHTVWFPWIDSWPKSRNQYLRKVDELQNIWQDDVLICVSDDDEPYGDDLWKDIHAIGDWALEQDINQIGIRCHSILRNLKGQTIRETIDDYYKGLIIVWEEGLKYIAKGHDLSTESQGEVHEFLIMPSGTRHRILSDKYFYYHIKTVGDTWQRAARNMFAGGGGKNLAKLSPLWMPFRQLVQKHAPWVKTSMDFEKYLKDGNIHQEVKNMILSFRFLGTPHDSRKNLWPTFPDGCSEYREVALTYFCLHHPEELSPEIIEADQGKLDWRSLINEVHGQ